MQWGQTGFPPERHWSRRPMDRHSWLRLKMVCFATLQRRMSGAMHCGRVCSSTVMRPSCIVRSEEHTSELQSHLNLVCRLLLEKKKKKISEIVLDFVKK